MNEFQIKISGQDLEMLGKLLSEHPYKIVAPIIQNFNKQVQEQLNKEKHE